MGNIIVWFMMVLVKDDEVFIMMDLVVKVFFIINLNIKWLLFFSVLVGICNLILFFYFFFYWKIKGILVYIVVFFN